MSVIMEFSPKVVIVGAGAAGLMCAITAAQRGQAVLIIDHATKAGKKILIAGGGRCNFTNYYVEPVNYVSHNPHFCKSALSRYSQWDFISLVEKHGIKYHEKTLGQLFCDDKSHEIRDMLVAECEAVGVQIRLRCEITQVERLDKGFQLATSDGDFNCESLVIASGGLSFPTMGGSGFGYDIARQFGLAVFAQSAGLVPFTLHPEHLVAFEGLSGTSVDVSVTCGGQSFRENILFTHRGLSGPAILQISSFWQPGQSVTINLLPDLLLEPYLIKMQKEKPKWHLNTLLNQYFSKKLSLRLCEFWFKGFYQQPLAELSKQQFMQVAKQLHEWDLMPAGTEGYKTAEVTLGGVDTDEISSKTFESKKVSGLYFVGEVLDVTGHLGGFNFQWAWASGFAAGQSV